MEEYLFKTHLKKDGNHTFTNSTTIVHPEYDWWCGTPDGFDENSVWDIKAPYTRESFGTLVKYNYPELMKKHKMGAKYKWQLVSNIILLEAVTGVQFDCGKLIVYMPYLSELEDVRKFAELYQGEFNVYWVSDRNDNRLPHILDGGKFKNINFKEIAVTQEDKNRLTERVIEAGKLLIERNA